MSDKTILGIDIGGTKINAAIVQKSNIIGEIHKISTPPESKSIVSSVTDIISLYKEAFDLAGVGIATAGVIDIKEGKVLSATENLAYGYSGLNYRQIIKEKFNLNTFIDNDANAAAFGELMYGAAFGAKNAIVITVGTGIGAGIIINGNIYRGHGFAAGECGHIIIETLSNRQCTCGKTGCWEAFASGPGLVITAKELSLSKNPYKDIETISTYKIIDEVKQNTPFYVEAYDLWHKYLAAGLISLINTLAPECIVLGGSMAQFMDFNKLNNLTIDKSPAACEIKKARLNNNAGIIGCAALTEKYLAELS